MVFPKEKELLGYKTARGRAHARFVVIFKDVF